MDESQVKNILIQLLKNDKEIEQILNEKINQNIQLLTSSKIEAIAKNIRNQQLSTEIENLKGLTETNRDCLIFISNIEVVFAITAEKYKKAYDEITEYVKKKDKRDIVWSFFGKSAKVLLTTLKAGVMATLTLCSKGLAAPVLSIAFKIFKIFKPVVKKINTVKDTIKNKVIQPLTDNKVIKPSIDDINEYVHSTAEASIQGLIMNDLSEDLLVDPYTFFLKANKQLQSIKQSIISLPTAQVKKIVADIKKNINNIKTQQVNQGLGRYSKNITLEFLFKPSTDEKTKSIWESLEEDIYISMRRLIWRNYCRSCWHKKTGRYVVTVDSSIYKRVHTLINKRPSDWPNDVWSPERGLWPRHFEYICNDFREKDDIAGSKDACHWSRMIVQCCQVQQRLKSTKKEKILKFFERGLLLDLSVIEEYAISNGKDARWMGETAFRFLTFSYDQLKTDTERLQLFYEARTKGGGDIQITEIRVGKYRKTTALNKTRGPLGILTSPNEIHKVSKGVKLSVIIEASKQTTNTVILKICKAKPGISDEDFINNAWKEYDVKNGFSINNQYAQLLDPKEMASMRLFAKTDPLIIGEKNFTSHTKQYINIHCTHTGLYSIVLEMKDKKKDNEYLETHCAQEAHGKVKKIIAKGYQGGHSFKGISVSRDKWFFKVI